ncbi:MAG: MFS transporter [Proteobacteria bacterium]|nr:MFS transporter [Pseudomonadota bacterium]
MSTMSHDRLRFLFLNLGHAYAHLFMLLYATVVLVLERELGRDYGDLLLPSTAGFVAFAAGTVPAGWLGDRWSKQGMLAVMFLGLGVASLLMTLAAGVWQIAAGLAAIGLFASIYHPIGIAMVAEEGTQGTGRGVGRALGVNGVWGNMGVAAAPLLAGTLGTVWGWRAAFAVPGAVALLTGLGFLLLIRHAPPAKERRAPPVARPASRALIRRVFIFVPVASLFGGLVFSAMTVALPKILAEALAAGGDGGLMSAGTLAAAIFALAAFAQIATGRGVDRMSPRDLMLVLAGGQLVLFVLLAQVAGWPVLLLGLLVMPLVFGEIPIHDALVAHYGAPEWRARIYALKYVLSLGVSSIAVPLVAWLHLAEAPAGNGFVGLYIALAVAAALLVAVSLLLPGRRELAAMVQAAGS